MFALICDLLATATIAIFAQNLVFTGGYGLCELLRAAAKPRRLILFCGLLTGFSIVSSAIDFQISRLWGFSEMENRFRMLFFVAVIAGLYLLVVMFIFLLGRSHLQALWKTASLAAFNSAVLAIPFFNYRLNSDDFKSALLVGFTGGIGFFVAALLVRTGLKRLQNPRIPAAFRGLPIAFIYIAILSLIFLGIRGTLLIEF